MVRERTWVSAHASGRAQKSVIVPVWAKFRRLRAQARVRVQVRDIAQAWVIVQEWVQIQASASIQARVRGRRCVRAHARCRV